MPPDQPESPDQPEPPVGPVQPERPVGPERPVRAGHPDPVAGDPVGARRPAGAETYEIGDPVDAALTQDLPVTVVARDGSFDEPVDLIDQGGGRHRAGGPHRWVGMPPRWILPAAATLAIIAFVAVALWAFRSGPNTARPHNDPDVPGVLPFEPPATQTVIDPPTTVGTSPTPGATTSPTTTATGATPTTVRPPLLPSPVPLLPPPGGPTPTVEVTVVTASPTAGGGPPSQEPEPEPVTAAARTDNWGSGYNTYVTVRNTGTTPVQWQVRVVLGSGEVLKAVWNGNATPAGGTAHTFGSSSGSLVADGTYTFGFQVEGRRTNGPVSCTVVGGSACGNG